VETMKKKNKKPSRMALIPLKGKELDEAINNLKYMMFHLGYINRL